MGNNCWISKNDGPTDWRDLKKSKKSCASSHNNSVNPIEPAMLAEGK